MGVNRPFTSCVAPRSDRACLASGTSLGRSWRHPGGIGQPASALFAQRLRGRMAPGLLAWRLGRARRVPVFGRVGPPRRHVCHDRWPARHYGPGRDPRRTGGRCPATAVPSGRSGKLVPRGRAARAYAVVRRTRRRGCAVRGAAVRAGWGRQPRGVACACCAR